MKRIRDHHRRQPDSLVIVGVILLAAAVVAALLAKAVDRVGDSLDARTRSQRTRTATPGDHQLAFSSPLVVGLLLLAVGLFG
jgi:hypothetical protein